MKKTPLYAPIIWTAFALWRTYRFFSDLSQIQEQAQWITIGDMIALIAYLGLAIYYWILFLKGKKNCDAKD